MSDDQLDKSRGPARPDEGEPDSPPPRVVSSETLLGGDREVLIRHGADVYRLIRTRNGKLLLNKD